MLNLPRLEINQDELNQNLQEIFAAMKAEESRLSNSNISVPKTFYRKLRMLYLLTGDFSSEIYPADALFDQVTSITPNRLNNASFTPNITISLENIKRYIAQGFIVEKIDYIEVAKPIYDEYRLFAWELLCELYGITDRNDERVIALEVKTGFSKYLPKYIQEFMIKEGMAELKSNPVRIPLPDPSVIEAHARGLANELMQNQEINNKVLTAKLRVLILFFWLPKDDKNPHDRINYNGFNNAIAYHTSHGTTSQLSRMISTFGTFKQTENRANADSFADQIKDVISNLVTIRAIREGTYERYAEAILEFIKFFVPNSDHEVLKAIKEAFDVKVTESLRLNSTTVEIQAALSKIQNFFNKEYYSFFHIPKDTPLTLPREKVQEALAKDTLERSIAELAEHVQNHQALAVATLDELSEWIVQPFKPYEERYDFSAAIQYRSALYGAPAKDKKLHWSLYSSIVKLDFSYRTNRDAIFASVIIEILRRIIDVNVKLGNTINLNENEFLYVQYKVLETLVKVLYRDDQVLMIERLSRLQEILNTL